MRRKRTLVAVLLVVGLFLGTYVVAWAQADRLATGYLSDAEAAYARGDYLGALMGYKEFDAAANRYVQRGGYQQVERIWVHPFALPRPASFDAARARIQEIIAYDLTAPMAEAYVQASIGKASPYLGTVYLRLGELYEEQGDLNTARQVYGEVVELFTDQPAIVARAEAHLAGLPR